MIASVRVLRRLHFDVLSLTSEVALCSTAGCLVVVRGRLLVVLVLVVLRLLSLVVGVVLGLSVSNRYSSSPASAVERLVATLAAAPSRDAAA